MAAITTDAGTDAGAGAAQSTLAERRRRRPRVWRGLVLALAGLYFIVPLVASFVFTVHTPGQGVSFEAYTGILGAEGFTDSLLLSLGLAAATIALVLLLAVPALVAVRLGAPRLRPVVEVMCMLPLVVPPIALVTGITTVLRWGPEQLSRTPLYQTFMAVQNESFPLVLVLAYTVLALPFVYRSLDAGLRAIDVPTLVEAARNCGASWLYVILRVILPNLRTSLAGAAFLTLALVLGEFTIAALLGYQPFAVWIVTVSGAQARMSVAVSILSLLLTWALLLLLSRAGNGTRTANAMAAAPSSSKDQ
ncbi:ABC transporter permease subunit [Streptomyces lunaelactis]|uniref:ABC transporter permease n=1 Tax=Streptomyces lunaelactis TaxID=1535768 RepID=UPI0015858740|nr:ABC transporter permease subunit [Streptomyces lunaelactis]NUK37671.1 ABC transporter permease subunit [Streptomyces lunaelactis]NUK45062.1 ABC transporter permease subunit [Streptomyces lunaelactis]NUK59118.1 ABC transporter permease subunit [Streptomyces lunaelactis]NUK73548.1 ABC transporter permease subunit [Streptomyces lunaelactis]NUK79492.1 ABC transporter permease subunit [Streptomyces lunaelactis]